MSAKLFKCTPEELPPDLKANLLAMLQVLSAPSLFMDVLHTPRTGPLCTDYYDLLVWALSYIL